MSAVLAACLLGGMLPAALAQAQTQPDAPPAIVREVEEWRGANEKHFLWEDGSYTAVLYDSPIHYRTAEGWQEIDNTLEETVYAGRGVLENREGLYDVRFERTPGECWVTMSGEGYALSWTMDAEGEKPASPAARFFSGLLGGEEPAPRQVEYAPSPEAAAVTVQQAALPAQEAAVTAAKAASAVCYADVLGQGVDVEYTAAPLRLEGQVILEQPEDIDVWHLRLSLDGLTPALEESGELVFRSETGETVFAMPAPYMVDAAGAVGPVTVELKVAEGQYALAMLPDGGWLDDDSRAYPVRMNLSQQVPDNGSAVTDTYLGSMDSNGLVRKNLPFLRVGSDPAEGREYYSYIKFHTLPSLSSGVLITHAELRVTADQIQSQYNQIDVAAPISDWTTSLSWMTNPIHYAPVDSNVSPQYTSDGMQYAFNVTEAVGTWYKDSSCNHGLKLYSDDNRLTSLYSNEAFDALYTQRPRLSVDYLLPDTDIERGHYYLKGVNGKYLDMYGDLPAQGMRIMTDAYTGEHQQLWLIEPQGDGSYALRCEIDADYYVVADDDYDLADVYLEEKPDDQQGSWEKAGWYLYETAGGYVIRHRNSRTRVLDVYGMSSGGGAVYNQDIYQFHYLGGINQKWSLELLYKDKPFDEYPYLYTKNMTEETYLNVINKRVFGSDDSAIGSGLDIAFQLNSETFERVISNVSRLAKESEFERKNYLENLQDVIDDLTGQLVSSIIPPPLEPLYQAYEFISSVLNTIDIIAHIDDEPLWEELSDLSNTMVDLSHTEAGDKFPDDVTYTLSIYRFSEYRYEVEFANSLGTRWCKKISSETYEALLYIGTAHAYSVELYKTHPDFSYAWLGYGLKGEEILA